MKKLPIQFRQVSSHDVEQEGVGVVIERLVIEKELGEETQVLRVGLVLAAVDLEEGDLLLPVDLVARRVPQPALGQVPRQTLPAPHVPEAELAYVDARQGDQLLRVRREVPGFDLGERFNRKQFSLSFGLMNEFGFGFSLH